MVDEVWSAWCGRQGWSASYGRRSLLVVEVLVRWVLHVDCCEAADDVFMVCLVFDSWLMVGYSLL